MFHFRFRWSVSTDGWVKAYPTVFEQTKCLCGSCNGVYCIDKRDGKVRWRTPTRAPIEGARVAISGQCGVVGDRSGRGYCLDLRDGSVAWQFKTGGDITSSATIFQDRVFVGSHDGALYCLALATGEQLWVRHTEGAVTVTPVLCDGNVLVGSDDYDVHCFSIHSGEEQWRFATKFWVQTSPIVQRDRIFVASHTEMLCVSRDDRQTHWSFPVNGEVNEAALINEGRLVVASSFGKVLCLDARTGRLLWSFQTRDMYATEATAGPGGCVIFGAYDENVYCLDADSGRVLGTYQVTSNAGNAIGSAPVYDDGDVLFGSDDGKIYCLALDRV